MKKYIQIMKVTWDEYMAYRLNFVMWRVRMVMQLIVTYFLWWAIFSGRNQFFGYTESSILTYILLSSFLRTLVMGTRTQDVGVLIHDGDLSNWLLRPIYFIRYCISRDISDKSLNLIFSIVEISLLYIILRPPLVLQTNFFVLVLTVVAVALGTILFFLFSLILSYFAFWTPDIWAPRFLSFVVIEFFGGLMFPLDILPKPLYVLSQSLPFSYFIFFPLKVYLGQLSFPVIFQGLTIGLVWVGGLWYIAQLLWKKGLRAYSAEGR